MLFKCETCGVVTAEPINRIEFSFFDYGDYLITSSEEAEKKLKKVIKSKKHFFENIKIRYGEDVHFLDFGCGGVFS